MSKFNKAKWLKVIEFTVVGFAAWLNPSAGLLLLLLRVCFQILAVLQENEQSEDKEE